jgi:Fic family protein
VGEQLRRSGTASVKFSNAISHFTTVFTQVERRVGAVPHPTGSRAGSTPTGRPAEILALFAQQPELSAADVAQATGLGRAMVRRYLAQLVEEGRLSATAPPSSRNRTYQLPASS